MIRFIDLRNQGTGYRFAFWNTSSNEFITVGDAQAFDDADDLREASRCGNTWGYLDRLLSLCPDWTGTEGTMSERFFGYEEEET